MVEAFNSAIAFANTPEFFDRVVTRAEYLESGSNASRRKFADWKVDEKGKGRSRDDHSEETPVAKKVARSRTRSSIGFRRSGAVAQR